MIKINLLWAVSIYLSLSVGLVFALSTLYTYGENKTLNELDYFEQCPYCMYIFFSYTKNHQQSCPRCKSYILVEELPTRKKRGRDV